MQINQEGWTLVNTAALVADVACAIVPGATGAGPGLHAIASGQDIATVAVAASKAAVNLPVAVRVGEGIEKGLQFFEGEGNPAASVGDNPLGGKRTNYGDLGQVTDDPSIEITQLNTHAVEKHQVTRQMVDSWSQAKNKLFLSQNGGQRFLVITAEGAYVIDRNGRVITAYSVNEYAPELIEVAQEHDILE